MGLANASEHQVQSTYSSLFTYFQQTIARSLCLVACLSDNQFYFPSIVVSPKGRPEPLQE